MNREQLFTEENTQGYNVFELDQMNDVLEQRCGHIDEEASYYHDEVKREREEILDEIAYLGDHWSVGELSNAGKTLSAECPYCSTGDAYVSTGEQGLTGTDNVRCSHCGETFGIIW